MAASSKETYRSIQDRLTEYRKRQGHNQPIEKTGQTMAISQMDEYMSDPVLKTEETPSKNINLPSNKNSQPKNTQSIERTIHDISNKGMSSWLIFTLKCLLWCLLQGFFIEIEFGVAFFITSLFYFMYLFMKGGGRRKPWELSAYSVFNKDCERIEGTLGAEQFEQELRYGPTTVHR